MVSILWQHWQGQTVDESFPLLRYLGGNERSAAFQTSYSAEEPRLATIKLVVAGPREDDIVAQWNRAAQLCHPHLIRLFHIGTCAANGIELCYCVMEHAEEDLASVLRDRPLTPAETLEMLNSVLDALVYVHGKGFAYGHLKPANILAIDDCIKIASDCIVRPGEAAKNGEQPRPYDAPEVHDLGYSPSADMWSLGVTLTEALNQHSRRGRAAISQGSVTEAIPDRLVEIARSCLQRDPVRRATVRDVLAQLKSKSTAAGVQGAAPRRQALLTWRYMATVAAIALTTMVAGVGLLRRTTPNPMRSIAAPPVIVHSDSKPSASGSNSHPSPQSGTSERLVDPDVASTLPARHEEPGSNSGVPQIVHRVMPSVPQKVLDTIHGTVRVSVRTQVDSSGRVTRVELDSPGPSRYFAQLSLQAARQWQFEPSRIQTPNSSSSWLLRFEFTSTATRVRPIPLSGPKSSDSRR